MMRILATSKPTATATTDALIADMEEEVAHGQQLYRDGLILQAYMDESYTRTFMILEAKDVDTAKLAFDAYPQVKAGLIAFDFTPLIGMPAIAEVHQEAGTALPGWWPGEMA